ncbi:MAG: polyprenyl synthetase family protein [Patescibacteria group bacterium]|jgi:geranylgeranyl diphosphate synthase type I
MTSSQILLRIKKGIDRELSVFFAEQIRRTRGRHQLSRALMSAVGEFTLRPGAKRTRGTLVALGYLTNPRNKITRNILKMASAYEVLQSYLLIHDDIIDRDTERRGKPTLHKIFERYAPRSFHIREREQLGTDIAIIAGDVAADLVQRLVVETGFTDAVKIRTLEYIEQTLHSTYVGQVLDILAMPERIPSRSEQELRYRLKTATYTIEAPFLLGVLVGRGRIHESAFRTFAQNAGVGFQLTDDIQNVFGKGFSARSSDIRGGKITLLISYALESVAYRKKIIALLQKPSKTAGDLRLLKRYMRESGGYDKAVKSVRQRYETARKVLEKAGLRPAVRALFSSMMESLEKPLEQ